MKEHKIAAFGSHSALQILKGAKDEDFHTVCICIKGKEQPYKSFKVADEIILVDAYEDFFEIEDRLTKKNAILIPHASMISYLGIEKIKKIKIKYFGDKAILDIEADRNRQDSWLKKSNLLVPKIFTNPKEIDRPCIIKSHGAAGGKGYFIATSYDDFKSKHDGSQVVIQEYILGVPFYFHYFYSPLTNELEVMGFDKRYESNADGIGRITFNDQKSIGINSSYTVVGNQEMVIRESLLPEVFTMGENVVKTGKLLSKKGLIGPFCLESVITQDMKIYCFEISARIVAGTNVAINGSPYSQLRYNQPMSTGRRIAREIKNAIAKNKLDSVLG